MDLIHNGCYRSAVELQLMDYQNPSGSNGDGQRYGSHIGYLAQLFIGRL